MGKICDLGDFVIVAIIGARRSCLCISDQLTADLLGSFQTQHALEFAQNGSKHK